MKGETMTSAEAFVRPMLRILKLFRIYSGLKENLDV